MKIRDRLLMTSGSCVALILIFSLVVYVSFNRVAEENERELISQEIGHTVSELDIIMYDYLTYGEERMVQQWNSKYDISLEIIEKAEYKELETIKTNYADLKNLFSQIITNYEKGDSSELEERLVAQFLIKSHTIIFDSSRIAKEAYNNAIEAQRTANNSMVIALVILFVALMGISLHTTRHITKPLDKLTKGAEIIGKGDLEHTIDIESRDEIGELASAFNKMTRDLKESRKELEKYSKELEKRVEERTKELRLAKTGLEKKVEERTKELRLAKTGLEKKVEERTRKLKEKLDEVGKFGKMSVGRELRMVDLKNRVKELEKKLKGKSK